MSTNEARLQSLLNRLKARRKQERLDDLNKRKVDESVDELEQKVKVKSNG